MLKSMTIKNFKSIGEEGVTIHFAPITMLYGFNGAGKTNVIKALELVYNILNGFEPDKDFFIFNVNKYDRTKTISITIDDGFSLSLDDFHFSFMATDEIKKWFTKYNFTTYDELDFVKGKMFYPLIFPESGLHPKSILEMTEEILKMTKLPGERIFFIETHSEHMMLRILRRIGETHKGIYEGTLMSKDDVAVHWLSNENNVNTRVTYLDITDDGDFYMYWPEGFFDERMDEISY